MPAAVIKTKDELISAIKEKIMNITCNDAGRPVNLDNVMLHESDRSNCGGKLLISCIFVNEEGNLCGDMYRSGAAGCVDFFCGLDLNTINEKNLNTVLSALDGGRWSVPDSPSMGNNKKRNIVSSFKMRFLQKGA